MLSPNCHEKLVALVNCMASSTTRSQMAEHKLTIKQLLQENCQSIESATLIQQFLAYSIVSKRVRYLLSYLQDSTSLFGYYSQQLEEIAKRYIENRQISKIDQPQARPVRLLLGRKILQSQSLMFSLIASCRKDQSVCLKFMKIIAEALKERKPTGFITDLVGLCVHVLKVKNILGAQLVKCALDILNMLMTEHEGLQKSILPVVTQFAVAMIKQGSIDSESFGTVNLFLKYHSKQQTSLAFSYFRLAQEMIKQRIQSVGQVRCQKLVSIRSQESQQICQLLHLSNSIFAQHARNQKQTGGTSNKQAMQAITSLCQQLLLVLDSGCVHELYVLLAELSDIKNYKLYLNQCLINCAPYLFKTAQAQQIQAEVIFQLLAWLESLSLDKRNEVRNEFKIFRDTDVQSATNLFVDFIRITIESQFQFEFNEEMVKSVCNLFCFLAPAIVTKLNSKETVIQILKMLLNLNESCEKEYRGFMVKSILRIICVYANQLLPNNPFLTEVLESKISGDMFSHKQQLLHLAEGGYLTQKFYDGLSEKINNGDILNLCPSEIQVIFALLAFKNKSQLQCGPEDWEWSAYINQAGKRLHGKQWIMHEKDLKLNKETKMHKHCIEFEQDIARIDSLMAPKRS